MSVRSIVLLLVLAACSDYKLSSGNDPNDADDTDVDTQPDDTGWDSGEPYEYCNGLDDDGDGLVDEGYPDYDGDGVADCVDSDCDVTPATGGTVATVEECEGSGTVTVVDPWNVTIEWQYTSAGQGAIVMPAVGNLTDDNGDGVIDENDDPDIAFTTWGSNTLVALKGDGSGVLWEKNGYDGNAGVTIADVDNDGEPEVIAATPTHAVVAVDGATGTPEWTSSTFPSMSYYPQPTVADLDNDGDVEVIFDVAVVEGKTGKTITTLSGITTSWRTPVAADIDNDDIEEIILGEKVFSPTGKVLWSDGSSGAGNFAAVADIDGDVGGEVLMVSGSQLRVHDQDGTLIRAVTIPGSNPGPPCVADFDGDGDVEIAIPANVQISVYEVDGTKDWSAPMSDSSGLAGCSGYDVNGDGAYEVLFADEQDFRMYDGKTGKVLYTNPNHNSGTLWEYPVTADVDHDGSAEIVIASNLGVSGATWKGVTVFGHAGSGWPKSGPTWPTHDFAVTNISADNSVPSPTPHPWLDNNVFRARPAVDNPGQADLSVTLTDMCVSSCEDTGVVEIAYQVANAGFADADDVSVSLYLVAKDGTETLVGTQPIGIVPAATSLDGGTFSFTVGELGDGGFSLRVDDDGTGLGLVDECFEDNNTYDYTDTICGA